MIPKTITLTVTPEAQKAAKNYCSHTDCLLATIIKQNPVEGLTFWRVDSYRVFFEEATYRIPNCYSVLECYDRSRNSIDPPDVLESAIGKEFILELI